jgi:hypothetical protein
MLSVLISDIVSAVTKPPGVISKLWAFKVNLPLPIEM